MCTTRSFDAAIGCQCGLHRTVTNRTTDTRIFNPPHFASSVTQDHPIQVFRQLRPYGRCWKMILSDAGLETKVETRVVPGSAKKSGNVNCYDPRLHHQIPRREHYC